MFNYLVYTSKACQPMDSQSLHHILNQSRQWNAAHGITGILLYITGSFLSKNDSRFIQVLEGSKIEIDRLFQKIASDPRHQQVILLNESVTKNRNFPDWTLGFRSLTSDEYSKVPGFFELNDHALSQLTRRKFNAPLNMLRTFYQMHTESARY